MPTTHNMRSMRSIEKNYIKRGLINCDSIAQQLYKSDELELINDTLIGYMEHIPYDDEDYIDYNDEDYYFYILSSDDAKMLSRYTDLPIFYCEKHGVYFLGLMLGFDFDMTLVPCHEDMELYRKN